MIAGIPGFVDRGRSKTRYPTQGPNMFLMLLIEYNGFLSFDTKLEYPFSELFNTKDVLIVQSIRYIFNKVGFKTQLTAICGNLWPLTIANSDVENS